MSNEFDLDSLKSAWQEQKDEKNYSSIEIFQMLKRKSMTSVKWVFMISLIEVLLGLGMYLISFFNIKLSHYFNQQLDLMGSWKYAYEFLIFIGFGITSVFIYKFYKSYKGILIQSSVKNLSLDIIKFRKSVNQFIYINIVIALLAFFIAIFSSLGNNPQLQNIDWSSAKGFAVVVGILFSVFLFFGFYWLYLYVVYGTFQRRLKKNLKDLETIE